MKNILDIAQIVSNNVIRLKNKHAPINPKLIELFDRHNRVLKFNIISEKSKELFIEANIYKELFPIKVKYNNSIKIVKPSFQYTDSIYGVSSETLGVIFNEDGSVHLKIWSPYAEYVKVNIFDKFDEELLIRDNLHLNSSDKGIWEIILNEKNTGISNFLGYFYNLKIGHPEREEITVLDPYAKSLAIWNNAKGCVAKAAFVNPNLLGPKLNFANIRGFINREDAIIYEAHIRDFTVDPQIENRLNSRFGTFKAFIDKLPYIKELGVTHIQLLPVMSYFNVNENLSNSRELNYKSQGANYNWGYDPHSYFSLSGMYSENPKDPKLRIAEFKELIHAIHSIGLGVTLDVVFNHTAKISILEDLVPNYYHFMDEDGNAKSSFGGGRLGTTHLMARKLLIDSLLYFTKEFKVDGFRFDMMGDHDAETIQLAYNYIKEINPKVLMIGEGWRTFTGDDSDPRQAADQDWMVDTESVGVFSDEIRDELKSGYNSEGEARFISGGPRNIGLIFDNIKAKPHNFIATNPSDVVQYIEAHDNLTLHDVIAYSIKKDPFIHEEEIQQRIRIGNAIILTSQGTSFIHAGQEYGRTKQWLCEQRVPTHKETFMTDIHGNPFKYPYFIHDSYNSSDIINMFHWKKVEDKDNYPHSVKTMEYTKGLINLRKKYKVFRMTNSKTIDKKLQLLHPSAEAEDLILSYKIEVTKDENLYIFINGDTKERVFPIENLINADVLVDKNSAGYEKIQKPIGLRITNNSVILDALTFVVMKK